MDLSIFRDLLQKMINKLLFKTKDKSLNGLVRVQNYIGQQAAVHSVTLPALASMIETSPP